MGTVGWPCLIEYLDGNQEMPFFKTLTMIMLSGKTETCIGNRLLIGLLARLHIDLYSLSVRHALRTYEPYRTSFTRKTLETGEQVGTCPTSGDEGGAERAKTFGSMSQLARRSVGAWTSTRQQVLCARKAVLLDQQVGNLTESLIRTNAVQTSVCGD